MFCDLVVEGGVVVKDWGVMEMVIGEDVGEGECLGWGGKISGYLGGEGWEFGEWLIWVWWDGGGVIW